MEISCDTVRPSFGSAVFDDELESERVRILWMARVSCRARAARVATFSQLLFQLVFCLSSRPWPRADATSALKFSKDENPLSITPSKCSRSSGLKQSAWRASKVRKQIAVVVASDGHHNDAIDIAAHLEERKAF
jgi:hypothetical protein